MDAFRWRTAKGHLFGQELMGLLISVLGICNMQLSESPMQLFA